MPSPFKMFEVEEPYNDALVGKLEDGSQARIATDPIIRINEHIDMSNIARITRIFEEDGVAYADLLMFEREPEEGEGPLSVPYLLTVNKEEYRVWFYGEYNADAMFYTIRGLAYALQGKVFTTEALDSTGSVEDSLTQYEDSYLDALWEGDEEGLYSLEPVSILEGDHIADLEDILGSDEDED